MGKAPKSPSASKAVEALVYPDSKRRNIPTAELQASAKADEALRVAYERMANPFSNFNSIPKDADKTEFYQHDKNWTNRMILGDSFQETAR